jgi:hypothetical protein
MTGRSLRFARRFTRRFTLGAACLLVSLAAGCDHRAVPLVRSVPVALAAPADTKAIESAIESTLARRHWTVKEHAGQRYVANLAERGHTATIAIAYDAQSARIDYLESTNLLYEKGPDGEQIHRSYNSWVKNLADDIKAGVAQAAAAPR